jgi:hypothetical protein
MVSFRDCTGRRCCRDTVEFGCQFCGVGLLLVECNVARARIALGISHIELNVLRGKLLLLNLKLEGFL